MSEKLRANLVPNTMLYESSKMLSEDRKRLQREADIAKATRGPDYSRLETSIAKNKAEHAGKVNAGRMAEAQRQRGIAKQKMMEGVVVPQGGAQDRFKERERGQER